MSLPKTLSTMLTDVIQRANLENFVAESGTFISKPELRGYLNETIAELYDMLVEARGQEYYRKEYTFQTINNQPSYALPPDFYELISVDIFLAPNIVLTAHPYMESERNRFRWYPGWFYNMPVYYRLLGSQSATGAALMPARINFIPAPSAVYSITLNYIAAFRPFLTDGTEDLYIFDGINGWEGFATWNVAAICLEKMQKDSSYARARAEEFKRRIQGLAADRDAGSPERPHDVSSDYSPWGVP